MIIYIIFCIGIIWEKKCSMNADIFFKPFLKDYYWFFFFVYPVVREFIEKERQNIIVIPDSSRNLHIDNV